MNGEISTEGVTKPRIVYMKKGPQGYGFNLHGEKGVNKQTIDKVDKDSPADVGGLRAGDRVVEVNGTNVEGEKHQEVVNQIKGNPNEVTLLVVDDITEEYLKSVGRPVTQSLANIESSSVVEVIHNENVEENGETVSNEVVQDATDEDIEDAVQQVEAATVESSPEIEVPIPEPETETSSPEVEVPTQEQHEEVQESVPEDIHISVGNGEVDLSPPETDPPEPEPELVPEPPLPIPEPQEIEQAPAVQEIEQTSAPQEVEQTPTPQEVEQTSTPQEVEQTPTPQEVEQTPTPQEVEQTPTPQEVEQTSTPQEIPTPQEPVSPVSESLPTTGDKVPPLRIRVKEQKQWQQKKNIFESL